MSLRVQINRIYQPSSFDFGSLLNMNSNPGIE